jgi:putative FmdB family regulatory protein
VSILEKIMPLYDFECKDCGNVAEIKSTIAEKDSLDLHCEKCGSKKMEQVFQSIAVIGSCGHPESRAKRAEASRPCGGSGCACAHG